MKNLIHILNIIISLLGIFGLLVAMTAPMLFDAPGSENNTYLWVAFWASLALPFTCFGSALTSWYILYKSENYKKSLLVLALPCLNVAIIVICMTLIQVYCQGNFSCPT